MNLKGFKTLSIHIDLEENQFLICVLVCSSRTSKTNIKPYMRIFTSDQNSEALFSSERITPTFISNCIILCQN